MEKEEARRSNLNTPKRLESHLKKKHNLSDEDLREAKVNVLRLFKIFQKTRKNG